MNCEETITKMIDYLDGNLNTQEIAQVEKHLESCESCMNEIRDLQLMTREISAVNMETPDNSLSANFYHMLHVEAEKQEIQGITHRNPVLKKFFLSYSKFAAGLALLIAGTFLGMILNPLLNDNRHSELNQLRTEVQSMKEIVMMNMLSQESPSERIKAVNYAEEIAMPNDQIIEALVKTLNTDKNVNVRMAAAYSLSKFTHRKTVVDSLVKSLEKQSDPIIQVVLMDILVQKREQSASKTHAKNYIQRAYNEGSKRCCT
ncbi:MAG: hypothetical protein HC905_29565 [Bacteroidales bacterium]|nr:hypothetical protein [Bacteroidales bacterium]